MKDRTTSSSSDKHPTASDHSGGLNAGSAVVLVSRTDDPSSKTALNNVDSNAVDPRDFATSNNTTSSEPAVAHDPYEFNASSEDAISCPAAKKMKFDTQQVP